MSKKRIKLVQIIADGDLSGGPAHVLGLLENIDKNKFEIYLICPRGVLFDRAEKISGVKVCPLSMRSKFDFKALSNLKKLLAGIQTEKDPFGPMIVHTHGTRAGLLGRLATPKGALSVYTEHRWDKDYHLENRFNEYLQKKTLSYLNHRTSLIIAVSNSVKDYLIDSKSAFKDQIVVIPNAIGTEELKNLKTEELKNGRTKELKNLRTKELKNRRTKELRNQRTEERKNKRGHHQVKIGTVGNLNIQKGHKYLIEAMEEVVKNFPHVELQIVGGGEEKSNIKDQISKMGPEKNITLLGRRENPMELMRGWDIFVLPSVAETFGIVILEALEAGLPIVSTNVGGITDIIDNKSAILVLPRDPKALSAGIIKLISHPAEGAKLARAGRSKLKRFEWSKVIGEIEREYGKLV
jgi:glycosyltransferase involved in cell wall biosynthesis